MDFELEPLRQSSNSQHQSDEKRININHGSHKKKTKKRFCSRIKPSIMRTLMFLLFTMIVIIIAILIICLTSRKSSEICQMIFKQMYKSSRIDSSQPRFIAIGDLNKDNKMDIVVANFGTDTIGIFLSNENEQIYSTGFGSRPYSIVINDFNNDNYLDIAVANSGTNNIGLFIGNDNGTFQNQTIFSTGSYRPRFITVADFNKDKKSDIAVVYYGTDNIGIILGNNNGSFQNPIIYSTGYDSLPYLLVVADFNQDNQLDIAIANYGTQNILVLLGYSNQTFQSENIYTTNENSNPSCIAIGDFNNDNKLDIVVSNYGNGNIGVFLGYGNGSFSIQINYLVNSKSRPQYLTVGYFNNDTYLDVVAVDSEHDQIHILLGYGNGSFSTLTTYDLISGSYPIMVVVNDFNNNNQSDIIIANYGTNNIIILTGYSFRPSVRQKTYFVGHDSRPCAVVIYDIDNDGILDMVVDNFNDDYLLIFNGENDGSFVKGNKYSTGSESGPQHHCLADLNNDGRIDIIIANLGSNSVGVLLGQNNGTFANVTTYSTGDHSQPWSVDVGDLNNDNYLDIVVANIETNNFGVFIGYGNGTFANMVGYFTGLDSHPQAIAVGDFNNDNNLDIAVCLDLSFQLAVFLGNGTGIFGMFTTYFTGFGSNPRSLVLADLNRDNHLDIVVASISGYNIGIFFGIGDGTFMTQVVYWTGPGSEPTFVTTADFNTDDNYDIVVTNFASDEVIIFFGDGNGSFELAKRYSTGLGSNPYGIAVADLNNDKHLEIIVTYWGSGYVAVLTEYNAAQFANRTTYLTGSAPHPYLLAVNDFNSDNRSDIVVVNSGTNDLAIYLDWKNGSFGARKVYSIETDSYPQYVITGDINKDKHQDIVTVNSKSNSISLFMGDGNGNFGDQMIYSTGDNSNPYAISMNDFNNDSRLDFVIANEGTDSIGIFIGFNYTTFQSENTYFNENNFGPSAVCVNDFNNDNHLDIAAVFEYTNNLGILFGYGNRSFTDMRSYSTGIGSAPVALAVSDFNNDLQLDTVVANILTNNIGIFLGYHNGVFGTMVAYSTGDRSKPYDVAVGDFNNDGRTDIVTVNSLANNIGIFLGYGNGSFAIMVTHSTGDSSSPNGVAVGDFNNDGRLDIAVVNYGSNTAGVFLGYGDGNFKSQVTYATSYYSRPWRLAIGDFNNDSQSDIVTANYNGNSIDIFLGYGNGSFATAVTYSSGDGSGPQCVRIGDFNNDNIPDIAASNTASNNFVVLFGFGDGTFLLGTAYSTGPGSIPKSLAIADFNNDTRLDIIVTNSKSNSLVIFLGYGNQPFAGVTKYSTGDGSKPHSVAVTDFNNDGWLDIIVANYGTDNFGIFLGYGSKGFHSMITYSTGINSAPYSVAIADFNYDNQPDVVITNSNSDNIAIFLRFNNGTFDTKLICPTGARSSPHGVAIGDLNNDSILDIVIANSGTNNIFVLYGYEGGTFGNPTLYQLGYGYHPYSVAITDLNQDNQMDIVIACYGTDHIEIFLKMC